MNSHQNQFHRRDAKLFYKQTYFINKWFIFHFIYAHTFYLFYTNFMHGFPLLSSPACKNVRAIDVLLASTTSWNSLSICVSSTAHISATPSLSHRIGTLQLTVDETSCWFFCFCFFETMAEQRYVASFRCPNCLINFNMYTPHDGAQNCRICWQMIYPLFVVSEKRISSECNAKFWIRWNLMCDNNNNKNYSKESPSVQTARAFSNRLTIASHHQANVWDVERQEANQHQPTKVHRYLFDLVCHENGK